MESDEKIKELEINDALEYANGIINTVREPLIVLDSDLKVISASRSFYQIFKVKPEEAENQYVYDLGNKQWDIPKLRELLENILPYTTSFDNFEVEHNFPDIGARIMLLNGRAIYQKVKRTKLILLAIEDITERKGLEKELKALASHDELTGCENFRSIMKFVENEIIRCKRYQREFSIIMIDIDNFKKINDEYSHAAGNDAIAFFANIIKKSSRTIDMVGRYGGDEFIILLPEASLQSCIVVLDRIRNNLEHTKINSVYLEKDFILKFSSGVALYPSDAKDLKELITVADSALRQGKQQRKNEQIASINV